MECKYCKIDENLLIKRFDSWNVLINSNQYFLGRQSISLKRRVEELTDITNLERDELFYIMKKSKDIVTNLFDANLFNYFVAENITKHLHIHLIPRYNHSVNFEGYLFKDELCGKNHSFYPRDFKIDENLLEKIKNKIIEKL